MDLEMVRKELAARVGVLEYRREAAARNAVRVARGLRDACAVHPAARNQDPLGFLHFLLNFLEEGDVFKLAGLCRAAHKLVFSRVGLKLLLQYKKVYVEPPPKVYKPVNLSEFYQGRDKRQLI
jgi:hypothetical protein